MYEFIGERWELWEYGSSMGDVDLGERGGREWTIVNGENRKKGESESRREWIYEKTVPYILDSRF